MDYVREAASRPSRVLFFPTLPIFCHASSPLRYSALFIHTHTRSFHFPASVSFVFCLCISVCGFVQNETNPSHFLSLFMDKLTCFRNSPLSFVFMSVFLYQFKFICVCVSLDAVYLRFSLSAHTLHLLFSFVAPFPGSSACV